MMPPNVLVTPYPWSSVMIRRTLGAPLGGTTVGGQYGVESVAISLITPPNFGSGGGSCLPLIVVVALGDPGVPVVCICAVAKEANAIRAAASVPRRRICFADFIGDNLICFCSLPIRMGGTFVYFVRSACTTLGL